MKREEIEAKLFELIEQKSFEKLTGAERAFVSQHLAKEEFEFQRSVISATETLDFPHAEPLPLPVSEPKTVWYRRSVPLYQAVSAAAAIVILVWVLRSPGTATSAETANGDQNGASPVTAKVVYDTVIREVPVIQTAIRYIHDTVKFIQRESPRASERERPIKASREFNQLALTEELIQSNASSMKDDKTSVLLPQSTSSDMIGRK